MLLGGTGHFAPAHPGTELAQRVRWPSAVLAGAPPVSAAVFPWGVPSLDDHPRVANAPDGTSWLALSGRIFSDRERSSAKKGDEAPGPEAAARSVLARLDARGPEAIADFEGALAVAWWSAPRATLFLFRDAFGIEPLFYAEDAGDLAFASRIEDLATLGFRSPGLSPQGLAEFLTWGYVPGDVTLDQGVRRVPAGSWIAFQPGRNGSRIHRWYRLSFADPVAPDEAQIEAGFRELLSQAVARRSGPAPDGAFLSGGMDSSSVVALLRRQGTSSIRTFAFRCRGQSFDESQYARALAAELGTEHVEVEYGEPEALQKEAAVREMDVPFCDIGIVTASWLLGQAASGRAGHVLTGDGGDELWGSHPVYAAQKILRVYARLPIPEFVTGLLRRAAAMLTDSERKRDLRVQLKRILPPEGLTPELGPFRWRALWSPTGLASVLTPETASWLRDADPNRGVLAANEGYDGPDDGLSPHLYNDYRTASSFYFSRLRLLRRFGVEARCPFYDRDLVEFGARIPARLKLEGLERTKRLFRSAMRGILPEVVRGRRDKLGHSVPMKNWLRADGPVARRVGEVLAPPSLRARGLFRPDAVARLIAEHRALRANHSQRIWSLYVLEAWLAAREAR